jgi:PAT family beta-lactamase induction signal transducer AmpG
MSLVSFSAAIYHYFVLPELPKNEKFNSCSTVKSKLADAITVYKDFFKIEHIWVGLSFILFYRIGELIVMSIFPLFLKDSVAAGGLGMSNQFVGLSYGTLGAASAVVASLLGGYAIYKKGLKFWLIPMSIIMNLPHILYIYLAYSQNTNQILVSSFIGLEQIAFTFGLAANMFLMMYLVRNSSEKTSHYAFLSGCMLLAQMPIKMVSGYLEQMLGYEHLFILIFLMLIPSVICAYSVYRIIDPSFGRKQTEEDISISHS